MQTLRETATSSYNQLVSAVTNMSLPKTYKQAVFKEKNGPLIFEDVELKPPPKGEV